jgi:hypothetical protein
LHFGVLNSIFLEERLEHLMSGISCASLEPPTDFSNEDSLNDSSPQQRDSGDTKEQTVEAGSKLPKADEISDNGTCEANQKADDSAESIDRVTKADDSLPIIKQGRESCLPEPGPLLRCPYLDEISDSSTRYIIKIYSSSIWSHNKQSLNLSIT